MGVEVVEPRIEEGKAKIADSETIVLAVLRLLAKRDLEGRSILVSGGPSGGVHRPRESDNKPQLGEDRAGHRHEAWRRGASVSYVYGGSLAPPSSIRSRRIVTTEEMLEAVVSELEPSTSMSSSPAAAPATSLPSERAGKKIPKQARQHLR